MRRTRGKRQQAIPQPRRYAKQQFQRRLDAARPLRLSGRGKIDVHHRSIVRPERSGPAEEKYAEISDDNGEEVRVGPKAIRV